MTSGFVSRGHRAIEPFSLSRPATVAAAVERLAAGGVAHAGGIDVVRRLRDGERFEELVRLIDIDELHHISIEGAHLHIGAAVSHHRIETDATIADVRPDIASAWQTVGNVRIRRVGTIGGNLMMFDKDYDAAPILAATGAELVFADGSRCAVGDRPTDGLLLRIEVPIEGAAVRFDRSLKPVVSVAIGAKIAIGCAYSDVVVVDSGVPLPDPIDDAFASSVYRRRMIDVLMSR